MNIIFANTLRLKIKFLILNTLLKKISFYITAFCVLCSNYFTYAQEPNKEGWHFLKWGMSEFEVEKSVNEYTKNKTVVEKKKSENGESSCLSFDYEGLKVFCFFDKGLSQVKEFQQFNYPDSIQAAIAFDGFYYSLAEKLGETITIHDKRTQSKVMSWKFNLTRIKVLFYYSSLLEPKNSSNRLEVEMTYWRE
ncbi:MAG: hypothetical protein OHK0038_20350 [Flammeovirgaceae bacterium]